MSQNNKEKSGADPKAYWAATKKLTAWLLVVWFVVSYGAGILFRDTLDQFSFGGAPLGFWFAQNGSIYIFVALIFIYCLKVNQYEEKFGIKE
jgi:putative solute:sodium symporter small subunit